MMASGCLVLPHSRRGLKRSFWSCNFARPMQPRRSEGSSTLCPLRCMCPDPALLSHLGTPRCLGQPHAPMHAKPKRLIQPSASKQLLALCGPLHDPCALGNPLMFPSSPRTLLYIKSTWDLQLLVASQHPVQGLLTRMNHSGPWQAS